MNSTIKMVRAVCTWRNIAIASEVLVTCSYIMYKFSFKWLFMTAFLCSSGLVVVTLTKDQANALMLVALVTNLCNKYLVRLKVFFPFLVRHQCQLMLTKTTISTT